MNSIRIQSCLWVALSVSAVLMSANAAAQNRKAIDVEKARVVQFWTPERRAAAIPRDFVIDPRGLGYLRHPDGFLQPYGHRVAAEVTARTLPPSPFAKPGGGGPGGGGGGGSTTGIVKNATWSSSGAIQTAAGRLLFAMAGGYYVCSGTVVTDATGSRSIIATAAHCVYDDENKAFATNAMFIPDQAHTTRGSKTDFNCDNDPLGCWVPSFGVVDENWTTRVFPANIAWDYAFYVVNDAGAHDGTPVSSDALDVAAGTLDLNFDPPNVGVSNSNIDFTFALGYSYRNDPKFMYCAEDMTTENNYDVNWWLPSCGLTGGSSGGPWVQNGSNTWSGGTDGKIISVNSWGYSNSPGMAGPKLDNTSAECVFGAAKNAALTTAGGVAAICTP